MIELDEAHAAVRQPPRHQAVVGIAGLAGLGAIAGQHRRGLLGDVHGVAGFHLHAEGHFILGDAGHGLGIAELVPFGIYFAAVPAVLFAVIDGGPLLGVKVFIFYIVAQQIENYVLSPVVAHRTVGIPPLVVLLSFLMGITVAGFWGALIAIPVAVFILEYIGDVEKQKLVPVTINHTLE